MTLRPQKSAIAPLLADERTTGRRTPFPDFMLHGLATRDLFAKFLGTILSCFPQNSLRNNEICSNFFADAFIEYQHAVVGQFFKAHEKLTTQSVRYGRSIRTIEVNRRLRPTHNHRLSATRPR